MRSRFCVPPMLIAFVSCLVPQIALEQQNLGQIYLAPASASGDEILSFTYKDASGARQTIQVETGKSGTANSSDDIEKGTTGPAKAARIALAINTKASELASPGGPNPFQAVAVGHSVNLITIAPNQDIRNLRITNNTRQRRDGVRISRDPASVSAVAPTPEQAVLQQAHVIFTGGLAGKDDDGEDASVTLETNRLSVTLNTAGYQSVEGLCAAMVKALVAGGVSASLILPTVIRVDLDAEDGALMYGCTDVALQQQVSLDLK